jgi:hypothetical protein
MAKASAACLGVKSNRGEAGEVVGVVVVMLFPL